VTPVERLRAAADRLETLDSVATASPWTVDDAALRAGSHEVAMVFRDEDNDLIAALRPLAPILAKQLRDAVDRLLEECEIELDYPPFHAAAWCGRDVVPGEKGSCDHFDDALAIADAVLGEA
jgi:hypothetical protein